jgi:hypothetical protein
MITFPHLKLTVITLLLGNLHFLYKMSLPPILIDYSGKTRKTRPLIVLPYIHAYITSITRKTFLPDALLKLKDDLFRQNLHNNGNTLTCTCYSIKILYSKYKNNTKSMAVNNNINKHTEKECF